MFGLPTDYDLRLCVPKTLLAYFDIGLGMPVTFSQSEQQGVHKVSGTQLDAIDLEL